MSQQPKHEPKCLICEQPMQIVTEGDDSKAIVPCVDGGHIDISFGYGSIHDSLMDNMDEIGRRHYAYIHDECYDQKKHLVRNVRLVIKKEFIEKISFEDA